MAVTSKGGSSAGKLLWHVTTSPDGYIAGPGYAMDWVFEDGGPDDTLAEVIEMTGALLVGRRTYEVAVRYRRGFYGGAGTGAHVVLTYDVPGTVPDWMTGVFVSAGIEPAVARAKEAAGGKNVVVLGATVARQCPDRGLLDELLVHPVPALLQSGEQQGRSEPLVVLARDDRAQPGADVVGDRRHLGRGQAVAGELRRQHPVQIGADDRRPLGLPRRAPASPGGAHVPLRLG
jgi:dihydrofolate reductase